MRADARKNYAHLLAVARAVITEHGAEASLRDIARKAGVGLATLYRHFPTREALLEALLHATLAELTQRAGELEKSDAPDEALLAWFRVGVAFVQSYSGVVNLMAAVTRSTQESEAGHLEPALIHLQRHLLQMQEHPQRTELVVDAGQRAALQQPHSEAWWSAVRGEH